MNLCLQDFWLRDIFLRFYPFYTSLKRMGPVLLQGNFPTCTGFLKLFKYPLGSFGAIFGVKDPKCSEAFTAD